MSRRTASLLNIIRMNLPLVCCAVERGIEKGVLIGNGASEMTGHVLGRDALGRGAKGRRR